ncbi:sugar transferase [Antrihabitans cavernicola]|uniref:Sugar transferase n=1 Tax=Antrihabitans cavernicola TaxID=2495913 RepID=A0A5A7S7P9_9NOCA|nr:sugar transferase [Spelaeibacter cavernicola]KAA0018923.1 sugar transferase [Spelaeibacter cavernicola]
MNFKANVGSSAVSARGSRAFWNSERERWQSEYKRRVQLTDAVVVTGAVALGQVVRFGTQESILKPAEISGIEYTALSVSIAVVWLILLTALNTRSPRVMGNGAEEYRRIGSATLRLFGLIAIASLLFQVDIARGYLAIAFPLGLIGLVLSRQGWRKYAVRQRRQGSYQTTVLVVGARNAARSMTTSFARDHTSGYRVVGVCTPGGDMAEDQSMTVPGDEVPIVGDEHSILDAVKLTGADTVVVTATEQLGNARIRDLVWELEPLNVDLVVTPGVVDVAGQRLEIRPVADMPLVHIEKPQYDRAKSFGKHAFDFCFALFALIAIAPVMLAVAIAIKTTSRGSVFYKSERMGIDGKPFAMIKFRSMYEDADRHLDALLRQNEGAGVLFKMRDDPRVTPIGKIMRKYSLDELPQFINVLRGEMSVVGPRPPLRREVEAYDGVVRRRLLVKPGVTGLWQVSGRSDLSWDESVRLDLSYVENWSMVQDLLIIKKTLSAVARSEGAY